MERRIKQLATTFRSAIENAKKEGRFTGDQCFRNYPRGCCGIASELLAKFLIENGINVTYVRGTYYGETPEETQSHAWLEVVDGIIIDITGDQFKYSEEYLYYDEPVYVGPNNSFYELFEVDFIERCDKYYTLDNTRIHSHLSRSELYEIICDYIGV